ncbi:hypothetical protein ACFYXC_23255 [Streptomyces sp. NPDC002701]|uniref:hypothetical protein n=1 Tax=Streptomyces sp. NPDC002701 TaxID=3364661 RepID=UPI003676F165
MGTGGASWRGPAPGVALLAAALVCGVTGCGGSGGPAAPRSGPAAPVTATPPEVLCARVVAYWSREVLDGDTYGDYQSMGLSNRQYEILKAVVDTARTEREREGAQAAERLIDRVARDRCEERYRDGNPSEGPWS